MQPLNRVFLYLLLKKAMFIYRTRKYFSGAASMVAWAASLVGVLLALNGYFVGWLLMAVALCTLIAYHTAEVDLQNQIYREGIMVLGQSFGKMLPLPGLDFLYLKGNTYSQFVESRASMATFRNIRYDGYLRLADGNILHLLQRRDKEKAWRQMEQIAQDLQVELRDLTGIRI